MLPFLLLIVIIVLVVSHLQLRDRVETLERSLSERPTPKDQAEEATARDSASTIKAETKANTTIAHSLPAIPTRESPRSPDSAIPNSSEPSTAAIEEPPASARVPATNAVEPAFPFVAWFREQTLIKVGAIIFFFGAAWFVGLAFEENWISPIGRVALGFALGVLVALVGHIRAAGNRTQYLALTALGVGIVIATVYASQFAFTPELLLPPPFAFFILLCTIAYTVAVSVRTGAEWMAALAAASGYLVPVLTNSSDPASVLLMLYLFVYAAGFLVVALKTSWRTITVVTQVGTIGYILLLNGTAAGNALWLLVVATSALFLAATTASLLRSTRAHGLDILVICLGTFAFIAFAHDLALAPGIACFVAAAVTAGIGYVLRERGAALRDIVLYAGAAAILIFTGTAYLFSGVTLTLIFTLEAALALTLATHVRLPGAAVMVVSCAYVLPLATASLLFSDPAWQSGVLHAPAGTLTILSVTLLWTMLWLLEHEYSRRTEWGPVFAGVFGWVGYAFCGALLARFSATMFAEINLTYLPVALGLALLSTVLLRVVLFRGRGPAWAMTLLASLAVPLFLLMPAFTSSAWQAGVWHAEALGLVFFLALLSYHVLVFFSHSRIAVVYRELYEKSSAAVFFVALAFSFLILARVWSAVLPTELALVMFVVSTASIIYFLTFLATWIRTGGSFIKTLLLTIMVPLVASLPLVSLSGWSGGLAAPAAVCSYVLVTTLVILGIHVRRRIPPTILPPNEAREWSNVLLITSAIYGVVIVWSGAQTVFIYAAAVAVALVLYTTAGLICYLVGRARNDQAVRVAGVTLLSLVVLRLVLVDVWAMEPLWRTVTFLIVGLLMIGAALIEGAAWRRSDSVSTADHATRARE